MQTNAGQVKISLFDSKQRGSESINALNKEIQKSVKKLKQDFWEPWITDDADCCENAQGWERKNEPCEWTLW